MKTYNHKVANIDELIPYVNNSRTHSEEQIIQIASSMREFGFTNPVLIDSDNMVIAGHGRILAARKLNINEIPCIVLEGLTETQKKAYIIADNRLPLNAGWDIDVLKNELDGLVEIDFDISLLGFDDDDFGKILTNENLEYEKNSARGGHYNDSELVEAETLKLAYRIESLLQIERVKAIELFAGQGSLTSWYNRSFNNVISNDIQIFKENNNQYSMSASKFIKNELIKHIDFDFIDFDDEGCPAKEIQEFFKTIRGKKQDKFVLAVTDGQGLNLKCHGKINFFQTYMVREDITVQSKSEDYYNFTNIFKEFIEKVTYGFKCSELSFYLKDNGNVIYATYLIENV